MWGERRLTIKSLEAESIKLTDEEKAILLNVFPKGVVVFDLETTGLSSLMHEILEIGALKLTSKGDLETFCHLVRPNRPISESNTKIHGSSNEMVKSALEISYILPQFLAFMQDLPLVAHNAKFDMGFLITQMHKLGLSFVSSPVYCTVKLSRLAFLNLPSYQLGKLAQNFSFVHDNAHRALDDAFVCLRLLVKALEGDKKSLLLQKSYLFNLEDFQGMKDLEVDEKQRFLFECLDSQKPLEIRYQGGSKKNRFRPIKPISILPFPQGYILYAHCLESDHYKHYFLKKITECRPFDDT
jgi:DNA polymerase III epsilon subunit family exonuclease